MAEAGSCQAIGGTGERGQGGSVVRCKDGGPPRAGGPGRYQNFFSQVCFTPALWKVLTYCLSTLLM